MKTSIVCFFLFIIVQLSAQDINQFDANGKRHGIWKKNFDNTSVLRYEGEFLHGKEVGVFKFYKNLKNKAVLTATKEFNLSNNKAYVKFLSSLGKIISEGKMDGKNYIGEWKYYQKTNDKLLTLEYYTDSGVLDGERFVYYPNGEIAEKQFYKNGKMEGMFTAFSDKKVVLQELIYENGELHGVARYYSTKGELEVEGAYKRGKKDGIWKYYANGKLTEEKDFTYQPKYIKKTP